MKRRKRRFWDDDEKHRIVAQTRVPGVSVSQVARRYDVNANLVFKWLSNRIFKSYDEIVALCCEAWNKLIDQPWKIMSIGRRKWAHGF